MYTLTLTLTLTRCGDGSAAALGRQCPALTSLNLELLTKLTDLGVQAAVRGTLTLLQPQP